MSEFKITAEQMTAMDVDEVKDLYFDMVNDELVSLISDGISDAVNQYDAEINNNICIMVDFEERALVFAYGVGKDLKSKQDSQVFYIHKIDLLGECFKMIQYLTEQSESYSIDTQVSDWLTDAVLDADYALDDYDIYVYGGYDYTSPSWWYDPFYDPEHRG